MIKSNTLQHIAAVCTIVLTIASTAMAGTGKDYILSKRQKPTTAGKVNWSVDPFNRKIFIENRGQFDTAVKSPDKVLFQAVFGPITANFTDHGIVYRYDQYIYKNLKAEGHDGYKDRDEDGKDGDPDGRQAPVIHTFYMKSMWEGYNPNVSVSAEEEQTNYFVYPVGMNKGKSLKVNVYKKIAYRNIYPGIDVEYTFPKDKEGLKYAIIVHPGADLSKVKLVYDGAKSLKLDNGNTLIDGNSMGIFTDHAPVSYCQEDMQPVASYFKVNNNEESFYTSPVSAGKTVVIDPWITDPLLNNSGHDNAYDLDYDTNGNVYVYGGYQPFELSKISSNGTLLWTFQASIFNSPGYYGAMACDRPSGSCYMVEGFNSPGGARVIKVDNNGLQDPISPFPGDRVMVEMWRAASNPCNRNIVIGGGGTNRPAPYNAFVLDTTLVKISAVNTSAALDPGHDVVLEAIDPNGQSCYMGLPRSSFGSTPANEIIKSPLPSLAPNNYVIATDSFAFTEVGQPSYIYPFTGEGNGMNGLAVSPVLIYAYNGDTIRAFDKNSAVLRRRICVNGGNTLYAWGGLSANALNDVYVGYKDSILVYDSSLTYISGMRMPNTVFDVKLGRQTVGYACGVQFVTQYTVPRLKLISTVGGVPTSCAACDGVAGVTQLFGGLPPFTYSWSNGETGAKDSLLCAGLYTVTVRDASCPPLIDTALVTISGKLGYSAILDDTNPSICRGDSGSITSFPFGGTAPYTYAWSNGATTQKNTGLSAGSYTLTIIDASGCKDVLTTSLYDAFPLKVSAFPHKDSICQGQSKTLIGSGVNNYNWQPSAGLSCQNCSTPIATPTITTTYTVAGLDSNGCTSKDSCLIIVRSVPVVVFNPPVDSICQGSNVVITASGASNFKWSPNIGLSCNNCPAPTVSPATTTTYTVIGSNAIGCNDTAHIQVVVNPPPTPGITVTPASDTICVLDSAMLVASGGGSYKWVNTSQTKDTIWVKPGGTTTYTLQVTKAGCTASITQQIVVLSRAAQGINLAQDSICPGDSTTMTAFGGTKYKWLFGPNSPNATVYVKGNGSSSVTYSVAIFSRCGTDTISKTLHISPVPVINTSGNTLICNGSSAHINASGGTKYTWTPAGSLSCNNCPNPTASPTTTTVYTVVVSNGRCSKDTTLTVNVVNKPIIVMAATPPSICYGATTVLSATGGGTYLWSNGATTSAITVGPGHNFTYQVVVNNGCIDSNRVSVAVDSPYFQACCDSCIIKGSTVDIGAYGVGMDYAWTPSAGLSCTNCPYPEATPTATTTYTVVSSDVKGCRTSRTVTICLECLDFEVPNVFTPNDDGINDDFVVRMNNYTTYSINIYDRWGKQVYTSTDPTVFWTGRINNTQNMVPDGTYYYVIDATCDSNNYKKKGFVQVTDSKGK